MSRSFWMRLRWLLRLWMILLATPAFTTSVTFAYDGQNRAPVAYDSNGECAIGYDYASALTTGEKNDGTAGGRVLFAKVNQFLAAETTAARTASGDFYSVA